MLKTRSKKDSKKPKLRFTLLPIEEIIEEIKKGYRKNDYISCLRRHVSPEFKDEIEIRMNTRRNIIVSIAGKTGSGKSWSGLSLAEKVVLITGGTVYYAFTRAEMLILLKNAKRGDFYILDEQIKTFGIGSSREEEELKNIETIVRKKQLNFAFLDPSVKLHVHHYILTCHSRDEINNYNKLVMTAEDNILFYVNIGVVLIPKPSDELIERYEKDKDIFINRVLKGKIDDRNTMYRKIAKTSLKDTRFIVLEKRKHRIVYLTDKYPNLAGTEIDSILSRIEIIEGGD